MADGRGELSLERGTILGRGPREAEPSWVRDPRAGRHEWRRLFSEVLGTFLLVVVAAGAPVVDAVSHGRVPLDAQVVAPGLMVMAIIYFMGMVSGAHLNPAVTLSFAARGNFPWVRVPGYILAQLVGATAASLLLRALFGTVGHLGATLPGPGITSGTALVVEALLTLGLVSVILGTASGARNVGANAALAVGGYIALAGLWAAPLTGASMNPARSFGPELVAGDWTSWWAYVAGPLVGGALAVGVAWILRGPPSPAADVAAQGEMPDGWLPGAGAPAPGSGAPAPGSGAPAPGSGAPAPGSGAPVPGSGAPAPASGAPAPASGVPGAGSGGSDHDR